MANPTKKKILVIDDEAVFRVTISQALKQCPYTCVAEPGPSEGIIRLKKESFDLLILDILMDPIDGWDILTHISSLSEGKGIPIFMVSAKKLDINEIIRYGDLVAGFIVKPFMDSELCEILKGFFTWYDALLSNIRAARMQGVPEEICNTYVDLVRQRKAIFQMMEIVSPRCIPNENQSEEDCMVERMKEVQTMITDKLRRRDEILMRYTVFVKA